MRVRTPDGRYHAPPEGLPRLLPVRSGETDRVVARRWGWDYRDLFRTRRAALADRDRALREYERDRVYVNGLPVGYVLGVHALARRIDNEFRLSELRGDDSRVIGGTDFPALMLQAAVRAYRRAGVPATRAYLDGEVIVVEIARPAGEG